MSDEIDREAEPFDANAVEMDPSGMQGQTFVGRIDKVVTESAYPVEDGVINKEKGKFPYINCLLDTDFMEEGHFRWKWKYTTSKKGLHFRVLQALTSVDILDAEMKSTGKKGLRLKNIQDLEGQTFKFERQDVIFGKDSAGVEIKITDFPMPIAYIDVPTEEEE